MVRVVDRETFMRLPEGTVFCKWEPTIFRDLCIKHETIWHEGKAIDWLYRELVQVWSDTGNVYTDRLLALDATSENGQSVDMDDATSRDGCFNAADMFVIFEPNDVALMYSALGQSLAVEPFRHIEGKSSSPA